MKVYRGVSEEFRRETVLISFETGCGGVARIPETSNCCLQFPIRARLQLHLFADGSLAVDQREGSPDVGWADDVSNFIVGFTHDNVSGYGAVATPVTRSSELTRRDHRSVDRSGQLERRKQTAKL